MLENIDRKALEEYQHLIRHYIKGKNGVYALYRGVKLYYVGLATNLRSRLKAHLRDHHRESWDRFSVYFTIDASFIKEMESLLMRIAKPPGNKQSGKFFNAAIWSGHSVAILKPNSVKRWTKFSAASEMKMLAALKENHAGRCLRIILIVPKLLEQNTRASRSERAFGRMAQFDLRKGSLTHPRLRLSRPSATP
jgi:hypothetical protein